jgi:uncharacterized protein (TIGR03437 family)
VALSTNSGSVTVPAQVTIAAGAISGSFSAAVGKVKRKSQSATITATFDAASAVGYLTLSAPGPGNMFDSPGISCTPRTVHAGGQVACEVMMAPASSSEPIQVTSSSDQVKVPAAVSSRAQQTSLTFQAVAEPAARLQSATVNAMVGATQVADTVLVLPADGPVLTAPARKLVKIGEEVKFTVEAVDPGDLPVQLAAAGLPEGASFDLATRVFSWVPSAAQAGQYSVMFTGTNSAGQSSSTQVRLDIGRGTPLLDSSSVACSPNSIAVLAGKWLLTGEPVAHPSGDALELGGTAVMVNGQLVPVLFASPTELDFLCPVQNAGTQLAVVVETPNGSTEAVNGTMQEVSPRVLALDGAEQAIIFFAGTSELVTPRTHMLLGNPAQPGDRVSVWGTGLGATDQILPSKVVVKFGDLYAEADSVHAVSEYAGTQVVEVQVPAAAAAGNAVPVCIEVFTPTGQQVSSNCAYTALELNRP